MSPYFQNAQNVVFRGTIINAGTYTQSTPGTTQNPLELLVKHIAVGGMHNSEERSDAPKCHAETRVAVQEEIISWITDGDLDAQPRRVMWMSGPAGTGKTAIAGSVAEICKARGLLAASFFFSSFSGSQERRSKRYLIMIIAYQLLQHDSMQEVGRQILDSIARNPAVFQMRIQDQLEELVLQPLRMAREHGLDTFQWPRVIILDGLDEVEPEGFDDLRSSGVQRAKEEIYTQILSTLMHAARDPAFPFRILIVSRPERAIRNFFTDCEGVKDLTAEIFLDEKYDPDADIALYLRSKFAEIRRRYNLPSPWPTEDAIRLLVANASGQFIYTATVIRFVSDPMGLPQAQLDRVLSWDNPLDDGSNPFAALDTLYTRILSSSPNPPLAVKWLATVAFSGEGGGYPALFWRQFLESVPGEGEYLLSSLPSLVSIPLPHDLTSPYRLYHKSLSDFFDRIPSSDALHVERSGLGGGVEFFSTCFTRVLKNKGPVTLPNEKERSIFFNFLFDSLIFQLTLAMMRVSIMHVSAMENHPGGITCMPWASWPSSNDDALSCDVPWWIITWLISRHREVENDDAMNHHREFNPYQPVAVIVPRILSGLFWDVHFLCPWHRCLPVCKLWRRDILWTCREHGWGVPGNWMLLRNRFVKWTLYANPRSGRAQKIIFPGGRHFIPPSEAAEGPLPSHPRHAGADEGPGDMVARRLAIDVRLTRFRE